MGILPEHSRYGVYESFAEKDYRLDIEKPSSNTVTQDSKR